MLLHRLKELIVKLAAPSAKVTLPCHECPDILPRMLYGLSHRFVLAEIDRQRRRETVDKTMLHGVVKYQRTDSSVSLSFQGSAVEESFRLSFPKNDHRTQGQQPLPDLSDNVIRHETVAIACRDDRVVYYMVGTILQQCVYHDRQRLRSPDHAHLHRIGLHVVDDRLDLPFDNICRKIMESLDTQCVLHRDGGDRRHGIPSQCRYRSDVSLHAGSARTVRTCYGENCLQQFKIIVSNITNPDRMPQKTSPLPISREA